jgi:hypothetical protein
MPLVRAETPAGSPRQDQTHDPPLIHGKPRKLDTDYYLVQIYGP